MNYIRYIALMLFLIFCVSAYAVIYQNTDSNGNITYTDVPSNNAKEVSLPRTNTAQAAQQPSSSPASTEPSTSAASDELSTSKPYTTFLISSPKDQETIQNQPIIHVVLDVKPKLQDGDRTQLYLDGVSASEPIESAHFSLNLLERGMHQLYAVLLDHNSQIVKKTPSITIFVHRNTINTSPTSTKPVPAPPPTQ